MEEPIPNHDDNGGADRWITWEVVLVGSLIMLGIGGAISGYLEALI